MEQKKCTSATRFTEVSYEFLVSSMFLFRLANIPPVHLYPIFPQQVDGAKWKANENMKTACRGMTDKPNDQLMNGLIDVWID